jgi:hypothetical protein
MRKTDRGEHQKHGGGHMTTRGGEFISEHQFFVGFIVPLALVAALVMAFMVGREYPSDATCLAAAIKMAASLESALSPERVILERLRKPTLPEQRAAPPPADSTMSAVGECFDLLNRQMRESIEAPSLAEIQADTLKDPAKGKQHLLREQEMNERHRREQKQVCGY